MLDVDTMFEAPRKRPVGVTVIAVIIPAVVLIYFLVVSDVRRAFQV